MGKVGFLFSLRSEGAYALRNQPRARLLRAHRSASTADVVLVEELLDAAQLGDATARRLFGDLAYRSELLEDTLTRRGVALATERARRRPVSRQQVEICFATLKGAFGMARTLAKTLTGLATRIAAKVCAYTYGLYVNRLLGRPQGRIKELWA